MCAGDSRLEDDGLPGEPEVGPRTRARRVGVPVHMLGAQLKAAPSIGSLIAVRHMPLEVRAESAQGGERESVRIAQLTEGAES